MPVLLFVYHNDRYILSIVVTVEKNIFTRIYEEGTWGDGSVHNPFSGTGSAPDNAVPFVRFVADTINKYGILSIFDFGHGDWSIWRDYKFENLNYVGVDVAGGLSQKNQDLFGSEKIRFLEVDENYILPEGELLICKEVLQHLSLNEINRILPQFSKFNYLILCNAFFDEDSFIFKMRFFLQFRTRLSKLLNFQWPFYLPRFPKNNSSIDSGGFRGIDLESEIFSWAFSEFNLLHKFDFDTQKVKGFKQRVLFYAKQAR
ncbi:MAG: hypothetical protein EBU66_14495 [Bacteroidetes bacterium]|nr:hypothetical protein [bacterium]NBP65857.1 hypothetical protein [Bacteroidota bacterium]